MSLHDVLLSLLRQPMSGSDLSRLFDGTIAHFWNTDLSQIYRALESLHRDGCVRCRTVPSDRGPARKVYELTDEGRRRLAAWVRATPTIPGARFEYLAQLFSVTADGSPRECALGQLRAMRDEARAGVEVLRRIDARMAEAPGYPNDLPPHLFYPWLTLRHGLLRRESLLQWIGESIERIEARPDSDDHPVPPESFEELMSALLSMTEGAAAGKETTAVGADDSDGHREGEDA